MNDSLSCNTLGRAITENKINVHSVLCFVYQKKEYLGVSGDGKFFEVFDVSKLQEEEFLSNDYLLVFAYIFLYYL